MEKEYIEREALLDEINIAPVSMSICMNVDECKGRIYERERLVRIINAATAADVRPVALGKWMKSYADHEAFGVRPFFRYCSECHEATVHQYNYCPNCGARMDGDGE